MVVLYLIFIFIITFFYVLTFSIMSTYYFYNEYIINVIFQKQKKKKLFRQAKAKRVQHHQICFTTNAKGTCLGGKHKRRKRLTKQTQNNKENGNRNIHINNNLECKWIKCPNQKTQTG